ncbi:integral membrane protein [Mycobacterium tuberculosis CAS/NITR204]|uniref:Integral membrane protein n=1 Tax=Mycobacterium tuberculosis CAS/NITR204 TaxID=1310114 RepID=R4MI04_MYCTX|nr:integral membrane protein [Mycobacterium tuberculosis CAS/NITR204]
MAGAIRTDFILSAEIMVIALNEVADQPFVPRLIVLVIVALVITAAVYGVVAVIVQMDDVGLRLTQTASRFGQRIGGGLVAGMPKLLSALSAVGMGAMLWVGGHIVLVGSDHLGWHAPYRLVHHLDDHLVGSAGGALTWLAHRGVRGDWVGDRNRCCCTCAPGLLSTAEVAFPVAVARSGGGFAIAETGPSAPESRPSRRSSTSRRLCAFLGFGGGGPVAFPPRRLQQRRCHRNRRFDAVAPPPASPGRWPPRTAPGSPATASARIGRGGRRRAGCAPSAAGTPG